MILSGIKGVLIKVDEDNMTMVIQKHEGQYEYPIAKELNISDYKNLVGKEVDVKLCDYSIIGAESI